MCRHLAWLGATRSVASLVLDPPFGLLRQSYAPRLQRRGLVNADGWGVGFVDDAGAVRRWRSSRPLWSDASFASVAPVLRSRAVLAAVRDATTGMPADETASAPFSDGRWLLSHNGAVSRAVLPTSHAAESTSDSALLAALVFERGVEHLARTVAEVAAADPGAYLNLLLTDGTQLLGVTWGDELYCRSEPDGVVVASEPWDENDDWTTVPDRHLVTVQDAIVTVTALDAVGAARSEH